MTYSVELDSQALINMFNSSAALVDPCCHD